MSMVNLELTGRSWPAEPTGNPLWPVRGEVIPNAEYRSEINAWVFIYPEGAEGEMGKDYLEWFAARNGPFAARVVEDVIEANDESPRSEEEENDDE